MESDINTIRKYLEGYVLEVNLEYSRDLHDLHDDYPLGPENNKIK